MAAYQKKLEGINGNIRVRMAPSPTGVLHIGTARTTLFNWLFARSRGGTFILRIEDTDKERSKPEFEKNILDGLRWLGLDWDEGPDFGGSFGPYRQSERTQIYKKELERLLAEDRAYLCFCPKEALEAQKQDAESRGEIWRYPGTCRNLSQEHLKQNLKDKISSVIRIKMPNKKISFKDIIKGESSFNLSLFGDIVIAKSTTEPLYNFAVVVDDHQMDISHVIRGEDHYSNTPKQLVIYEALGWPPPEFAHLPLILGQDKSKLSKRHGTTTSIDDYKNQGYLPEALINFIVLLGWHASGDKEIFSLNDLQQEFSLERVQKTGAIFNAQKLDWLNNHFLKQKPIQEIVKFLSPFFMQEGINLDKLEPSYAQKAILATLEKTKSVEEIIEMAKIFFIEPEYDQKLLIWRESNKEVIKDNLKKSLSALRLFEEIKFDKESYEQKLRDMYGEDKGSILWPLRVALSGRKVSPGPFEIIEVRGVRNSAACIEKAIAKLEK